MAGYLIFSHEHRAWWMPNNNGYTPYAEMAGVYSELAAREIVQRASIGWNPRPDGTDMLPHEVAVREDSYSLISAVAEATVILIKARGANVV